MKYCPISAQQQTPIKSKQALLTYVNMIEILKVRSEMFRKFKNVA